MSLYGVARTVEAVSNVCARFGVVSKSCVDPFVANKTPQQIAHAGFQRTKRIGPPIGWGRCWLRLRCCDGANHGRNNATNSSTNSRSISLNRWS